MGSIPLIMWFVIGAAAFLIGFTAIMLVRSFYNLNQLTADAARLRQPSPYSHSSLYNYPETIVFQWTQSGNGTPKQVAFPAVPDIIPDWMMGESDD